jgi:hypothetical protein
MQSALLPLAMSMTTSAWNCLVCTLVSSLSNADTNIFFRLGDAFLKYLASVYVFVTNPSSTEGQLHVARQRIISNKSLLMHSTRIGLPGYIQSKIFAFKAWHPPGFYVYTPPKVPKQPEAKPVEGSVDDEAEDEDGEVAEVENEVAEIVDIAEAADEDGEVVVAHEDVEVLDPGKTAEVSGEDGEIEEGVIVEDALDLPMVTQAAVVTPSPAPITTEPVAQVKIEEKIEEDTFSDVEEEGGESESEDANPANDDPASKPLDTQQEIPSKKKGKSRGKGKGKKKKPKTDENVVQYLGDKVCFSLCWTNPPMC